MADMAQTALVRCPMCNRKQEHRGPGAIYYCPSCQMQFDDDPDEGGTHATGDPSRRLVREEGRRRRHRRRANDKRNCS